MQSPLTVEEAEWFAKTMNELSDETGKFSREKIEAASLETKKRMVEIIVKYDRPILDELVVADQMPWLASMGYIEIAKGKNNQVFLCRCENKGILEERKEYVTITLEREAAVRYSVELEGIANPVLQRLRNAIEERL